MAIVMNFLVFSQLVNLLTTFALEENGRKSHQHVGSEPIFLMKSHSIIKKHNPMINAGAIMTSSLVNDLCPADRFEYVLNNWTRICGGLSPRFNNSVYLSELGTADRNFALAYFMKEHGTFPEGTSLRRHLNFIFSAAQLT